MRKDNIQLKNETAPELSEKEKAIVKTQWQLIFRQFKKNRLALIGLGVLLSLYFVGVFFPGFFAPYDKFSRLGEGNLPPQSINFIDQEGNFHLRPFTYRLDFRVDTETWEKIITEDKSERRYIYFFVRGLNYDLLGLFSTNIHLFGAEDVNIFVLGTDELGRDMLSRILYALRISLTIGFVGVVISLFLGMIFGGVSGLMGGSIDDIIQRFIEMLISIPKIPLWMALAAAVPQGWNSLQVYFAITIILSLIGWTSIGRIIRGQILTIREQDFVKAAESFNTPMLTIIFKHLIPNMISYVLVQLTLTIPAMILAETSLSFLGIGLRPPIVSLGVLLEKAQNFQTVSMHPWLLFPGLFVIIAILSFNFVGDGLRDAADPYS